MPFATTDDVAVRLGRALTAAEEAFSQAVIDGVTGLIADEVGKDAAWAAALDPVPVTLKMLCVEKAISLGANPSGRLATSETLGAHTVTDTFRRSDGDGGGVFLTDSEKRAARAAIYGGRTSESSTPGMILDDPLFDGWPTWPFWRVPAVSSNDDEP